MLAVAFAIAFAQAINDIFDRALDVHDKPDRPLPSGDLSLAQARAVAAASSLLSLLCALPGGKVALAVVCAVLLLSLAYSKFLKSTVLAGNIEVAALASSTIIYGSLATGGMVTAFLFCLQAMTFGVVLSHEVVKTTCDIEGDAAAGVVTIATSKGVKGAARIGATLCSVSILLAVVPAAYAPSPLLYSSAVTLGVIVPMSMAAWWLAMEACDVKDLKRPFNFLRIAWGGVAFVLLLLCLPLPGS